MWTRILLALLIAALALAVAPSAYAVERPNVLVIMTDDQRVDDMQAMPRTRALLADQGTTFTNSFVDFALCCPARATFFTGQYTHNHGVRGLFPPDGGYTALDTSNWLPVWLQRAGYRTMHLGKFLNGYGVHNADPAEVPPGFDDWQGSIDPTTYRFDDFTLNENGRLVRYSDGVYQTDLLARRGSQLIERAAADPRPFFFSLGFVAPHHGGPRELDDPATLKSPAVAPRHRDAFESLPLPMGPAFNEFDISDKPWHMRRRALLDLEQLTDMEELYQQRLESLLAVDEAVAELVETLRRTGTLDNTLIFFTSDNGYLLGEHRIPAAKVLVYEPSIRVPLLVRGPGIARGVERAQLVTNADLAPTILEAAQATPGKPQDGRSLLPLMSDPRLDWARDLLIVGYGQGARFRAIRTPRYLYARHTNGDRELYDLEADPDQLDSLHRSPEHAELRRELWRRLRQLHSCSGRRCGAGPRLNLRVQPRAGCVPGSLTVRMFGPDQAHIERVAVFVGRRRAARAKRRLTERQTVRTDGVRSGRRFRLRVRAALDDGRVLTLDRMRRRC